MQLKTTLGWRVDLCQFPTPCSGNGSVRATKMAYLAMQRFSLIRMIPNSTYFGQRPLFRLFQSGPRKKDTLGSATAFKKAFVGPYVHLGTK